MSKDFIKSEKEFLDQSCLTYKIFSYENFMRKLIIKNFEPFIDHNKIGLELGCSDCHMTKMLSERLYKLDSIDGCEDFIRSAKERKLPNVTFIHSLFEEYSAEKVNIRYDYVFATYILEHISNVGDVLKIIKDLLKPNGILFCVVPNSRALSRQLALHMGIVDNLKQLTENDLNHGHRRVYDRVSFNKDIESAGYHIISQGGILLKILANFQMDQLIDSKILQNEQLEGLYKLGLEYPDICGSLFSICTPNKVGK